MALLLFALVTIGATAAVAAASWGGSGAGGARSTAQILGAGNPPTAAAVGSSVTISWSASTLIPSGLLAGGYLVRRYDQLGAPQTIGANCTGTITGLSCTETTVANGTWHYSVTPVLSSWRGPESPRTSVTVAAPTVSSVSPAARPQGFTGNVTVTGADFQSGASVAFSGAGVTVNSTTFNSATQLTVSVTINAAAAAGPRNVTVTNPDGGTGSCTNCFTVTLAPTVASASPNTRGQGAANQNITIAGNFFVSGATVAFSGSGITVNSTTFNSATQLTVNITIAASAGTGARNVTVTNPGGFGTGTCTGCFTVAPRPGTFTLSPNSRGLVAISQNVTITGSNFVSGVAVSFSGSGITVNSVTFNSATQLIVNITISPTATTGARSVTVTNPDAGVRTTANAFTVAAAPTVTSTNPASRARDTTGNVTVAGTGFVNGATVAFSGTGITVNSTTFNSATQLTVSITIAAGAPTGVRNVTVTNPNAGTCVNCFTVS